MYKFGKTAGLALYAAAALALSACAEGGGGGHFAGGYGPDAPYDVWYDGFYGDTPNGYWGADDAFYYQDHDGHMMRDSGTHFRHSQFNGAHGMHAGHQPH
jgi:hypothetical protein